jgi:hypothetical protein
MYTAISFKRRSMMKKTIVLIMAIVLFLLIAGCGPIGNPLDLVGVWEYQLSSTRTYTLEFVSDGTMTYTDNNEGSSTKTVQTGTYIGDYLSGVKYVTVFYTTQTVNDVETASFVDQDKFFYTVTTVGSKTYLSVTASTVVAPVKYTKK